MASTLTKILLHITFSTKDRAAFIPEALEDDLHAYCGGICRRMGCTLLSMGGTADHVHMFIGFGKNVTLADLMLNVKRDTSKWIKTRDRALRGFRWQDGYFAFSIGESGSEALRRYIANQKKHHKRFDFKEEVRSLLRKYKLTWEEAYVWD